MLKKIFIGCFLLLFAFVSRTLAQQSLHAFLRYADFHIHPTYKHYFRPETADTMLLLLQYMQYDKVSDRLRYTGTPDFRTAIQKDNWQKITDLKPRKKSQQRGLASHLRNYDQASYPEIVYVPGSILCNSYSPYEKQFVLDPKKRKMSSKIVTKMGLPRLDKYADDSHTPFRDFLAEYYYNYLQEETRYVQTRVPERLYASEGNNYLPVPGYYNTIRMVKDARELAQIVQYNDSVFQHWRTGQAAPTIITPLIMSIEGAQVLYDTLSAQAKYILNPLNLDYRYDKKIGSWFTPFSTETHRAIHEELLKMADSLKNLHHRLFFITLGHFAQNHVVGFAKTLDREPESFEHRAMSTITVSPKHRNDIIRKNYDGFNPGIDKSNADWIPDSIGLKVVERFLNPDGKFQKPTYIDVKHMDIKARVQYYYMRRQYEKKFGIPIPIIASHFAVSGENQALAAATGLWPNFDKYRETENVKKFYRNDIFLKNDAAERSDYWGIGVMRAKRYPKSDTLDPFERKVYRPLDFYSSYGGEPFDPFINQRLDENKAGWFYPWSINLFDEEIIEISKSDGIIGLLLDPRQLGAYMPNYQRSAAQKSQLKQDFNKVKQAALAELSTTPIAGYSVLADEIQEMEYLKTEPLLRNMFYIAQVIHDHHAQEEAYWRTRNIDSVKARYPTLPPYVYDEVRLKKSDPWDLISIGGDFDGLIDPIDFSPTASYIPLLRKRLVVYAYIFARLNQHLFRHPDTRQPLIRTMTESHGVMERFFYSNGRTFILNYF